MGTRAKPLFLFLICGCAGATVETPGVAPMPASETKASLAGHRCHGDACECRVAGQADAEEVPPPAGYKRFEVRLSTSGGPAWVVVNGEDTLYLGTGSTPRACFYLDLPSPGDHSVVLRTKADRPEGGVGAQLEIAEHSPQGPWWYDTFRLQCGVPGPCATDDLREWAEAVRAYPRGLRDACGSTKIKKVSWDAARAPDGEHPEAFEARFVLNVYDFAPSSGPGTCGRTD